MFFSHGKLPPKGHRTDVGYYNTVIEIILKVRCTESSEILKLCDKHFEGEIPEYFFDRLELQGVQTNTLFSSIENYLNY